MNYLASKIRQRQVWTRPMSKMDECKQLIHKTLLAHVPVSCILADIKFIVTQF